MKKLIDKLRPVLKDTNNHRVVKNLYDEIITQSSKYLSDENIIGIYVECNAPLKPRSHDSFDISSNRKPYVSLIAVYDKPDEKYKSSGNIVSFNIRNGSEFGNYDFLIYYSSADNYNINKYKNFVEYRASLSLLRGIIIFDKYGLLTCAQETLPMVLNERLVESYGTVQRIKINKILSKKLPLIGMKK